MTALLLVAVFVLVLANGFFVATEFAIVAVRRSRLDQLVAEGRAGALAAKAVVAHLDSYIAATQFGITLASLALGWIGEPALAHLLEPGFAAIMGSFAPAAAHGVAIGVGALQLAERRGVEVEPLDADPQLVGPQLLAGVQPLGRLRQHDAVVEDTVQPRRIARTHEVSPQ